MLAANGCARLGLFSAVQVSASSRGPEVPEILPKFGGGFCGSSFSITRPNFPEFWVVFDDPVLRSPDVIPPNFFTIWWLSEKINGLNIREIWESEAKFPANFAPVAWCLHLVHLLCCLHPAQVANTSATLRDPRESMRMRLRFFAVWLSALSHALA